MRQGLRPNTRNTSRAIEIFRRDGVKTLGSRAIRLAYRRLSERELDFPLALEDISDSSRLHLPDPPPYVSRDRKPVIGWLTTPPSLGSGGHTTMFRMIEALEQAGHSCRVILWDRFGGSASRHRSVIREGWPRVQAQVVDVSEGFRDLDGCIATAWETAHVLASRCSVPLRHMFFIQDYEPYFYAHGSEYALAEDSYRFGFRCITIGHGVAQLLHSKLGVDADVADFGCDTDVYRLTNTGPRNGVVMYARPGVARRGYLHNVAALQEFHRRHPEQEIHIFGRTVGELPFPAISHGRQTPTQLNELYNRTRAGLATSFTNMTLVSEEMLAAGNIPVINDTEIGRAGLSNPHVVWADPTPGAMADALCSVIEDANPDARIRAAGDSVKGHTWSTGQQEFIRAVEEEIYGPIEG